MRGFKLKFLIFCYSILYSLKCFILTAKGQLPKYEILQLSHRLEKGLLIDNPKPLWGWEKAYKIVSLLKVCNDVFANQTGRGVLKAYIETKKKSEVFSEREKAYSFLKDYPEISQEVTLGGVLQMDRQDVIIREKDVIEYFFNSRHSCRDYQKKIVSKEDITAAIALARRKRDEAEDDEE